MRALLYLRKLREWNKVIRLVELIAGVTFKIIYEQHFNPLSKTHLLFVFNFFFVFCDFVV